MLFNSEIHPTNARMGVFIYVITGTIGAGPHNTGHRINTGTTRCCWGSLLASYSPVMTLGLVEDRPTPKEVYNFRTYLFALMASFGAMTFGYDSGVIG